MPHVSQWKTTSQCVYTNYSFDVTSYIEQNLIFFLIHAITLDRPDSPAPAGHCAVNIPKIVVKSRRRTSEARVVMGEEDPFTRHYSSKGMYYHSPRLIYLGRLPAIT